MRHSIAPAVVLLLLSTVSLPAITSFVAMRVEVKTVASAGDNTEMAVTVQIAPEDRFRLGDRAWVTTSLGSGGVVTEKSEQMLDLSSGSGTVSATWSPGNYELRVDVESATGDHRGFWMGDITVPFMLPIQKPTATPAPTGTPAPEPAAQPAPPTPSPQSTTSSKAAPQVASPEAKTPPAPAPVPRPPVIPPSPGRSEIMAPGTTAVTVLVTDSRNQPVSDLLRTNFSVKLGGDRTTLEGFAGPGSPVHLGFVVASSTELDTFTDTARRTALRLAGVATTSGGRVFVRHSGSGETAWSDSPEDIAASFGERSETTAVATEITAALEQFSTVSGRRILVVVIGPDDASDRSRWREAEAAAQQAGVPVLIMALAKKSPSSRLRNHLRSIAEASGGKTYSLRGLDLLEMTAGLYRSLVEASYGLSLNLPTSDKPVKIKVEVDRGGVSIMHSETVRAR